MRHKTAISWIALTAFAALAIFYVYANWQELASVRLVTPAAACWVAVCMALRMTLRGFFQWQTMVALGCPISCGDALRLNYAGAMMNMLLPMPVAPAYRAAYLKRLHNFPFSHFASTVAALFVFYLAASCILGLVGLIMLQRSGQPAPTAIWAVLIAVFFACGIPLLPKRWLSKVIPSSPRLGRILEGWSQLMQNRRLLSLASLVVVLSIAAGIAALYFAFRAFDFQIGIPGSMLLMSSQRLGSLVKLTPGAIGYQEMVSVYFATALRLTTAQAVIVLGMTRCINILVAISLGLPSLWWLSHSAHESAAPNHE